MDLKSTIRTIPNWPKEGIMFRDITSMLEQPEAFKFATQKFLEKFQGNGITKIAGIDARGFVFASVLAKEMNLPLVLIRKKGKLPGETIGQEYELEYGSATLEVHKSSIQVGDKVLIMDDLLATGGTALAAAQLVEKLGASVEAISFVIDLPDLNVREKLANYNLFHLIEFDGE